MGDKHGVPLYKTRWKGYRPDDDTWEPSENVASTGHIDRFERQQRQRTLRRGTAGVAVIEYEDGEREMVDMQMEKFRGYRPDSSDDQRDDDSVSGDEDVNDFNLLGKSEWIEILWQHTNMYFPCKIIYWTPIRSTKSSKKSIGKSSSKTKVLGESEELFLPSRTRDTKQTSKKAKQNDDVVDTSKSRKKSTGNSSSKADVLGELEESVVPSGRKDTKQTSKKAKRCDDVTNTTKSRKKSTGKSSSKTQVYRELEEPVEPSGPKDVKQSSKRTKRSADATDTTKSRKKSTTDSSSKTQVYEELEESVGPSGSKDTHLTSERIKRGDDATDTTKSHKKSTEKSSSKTKVLAELEESVVLSGSKNTKQLSKKAKRVDDIITDTGKRHAESSTTTISAKNTQPIPALAEPAQEPFLGNGSKAIESIHSMGLQEEDPHDLDESSIESDSSGLSYDVESHSDRPVEMIGQGVSLFDEPEDDFDSSDENEDDEEDGAHSDPSPGLHEAPKLSFEELWTLKLKRTQGLMDRGSNGSNSIY